MIKTFEYKRNLEESGYFVVATEVDKMVVTCVSTFYAKTTTAQVIDKLVQEFKTVKHRYLNDTTVVFYIDYFAGEDGESNDKAWISLIGDMAGGLERIDELK